MLVALTPIPRNFQDPLVSILASMEHPLRTEDVEGLPVGVHVVNHFNPKFNFIEIAEAENRTYDYSDEAIAMREAARNELKDYYKTKYNRFPSWEWEVEPSYGVCDNYQQILDKWPHLTDPEVDRKYAITMTPVRREEQESWGGWRWHKWGEYIGTQNPQCEYLYDEKDIDLVYCFHVYRIA